MKPIAKILTFLTEHSKSSILPALPATLAVGGRATATSRAKGQLAPGFTRAHVSTIAAEHSDAGVENRPLSTGYGHEESGNVPLQGSLHASPEQHRSVTDDDSGTAPVGGRRAVLRFAADGESIRQVTTPAARAAFYDGVDGTSGKGTPV